MLSSFHILGRCGPQAGASRGWEKWAAGQGRGLHVMRSPQAARRCGSRGGRRTLPAESQILRAHNRTCDEGGGPLRERHDAGTPATPRTRRDDKLACRPLGRLLLLQFSFCLGSGHRDYPEPVVSAAREDVDRAIGQVAHRPWVRGPLAAHRLPIREMEKAPAKWIVTLKPRAGDPVAMIRETMERSRHIGCPVPIQLGGPHQLPTDHAEPITIEDPADTRPHSFRSPRGPLLSDEVPAR
jgi:hypothetical protein